jgi:hypothetical protein
MKLPKVYTTILQKVKYFYNQLKLNKLEKTTGRPLKIKIENILTLALIKQKTGIETKKGLYQTYEPKCSYKTLVVNLNRFALLALTILNVMMKCNQKNSHLIKHTDSTDIPVCLNKNATRHKTMRGLSEWGHSGKGFYYGLKLIITTDLNQKLLAFKLLKANTDDRKVFTDLNKNMTGIFVADAGYIGEKLRNEFNNKFRFLLTAVKKNMKKLETEWQHALYNTRMKIEVNFRSLKLFYKLETSHPRSIDGYIANYVYSILAYCLR